MAQWKLVNFLCNIIDGMIAELGDKSRQGPNSNIYHFINGKTLHSCLNNYHKNKIDEIQNVTCVSIKGNETLSYSGG